MNRYIDADVLIKEIKMDIEEDGLQEKMVFYRINEAPSIDIESKQGEWVVDEGGWKGLDYYPPKCKCNQCGYEEELYLIHAKPTNFCPNCGCQMRVADDEQ